jgi:hypothetical protein
MIAGYDTYHDANQRRAVGAFVASMNDCYTRYNSSVKIHSANEEISPSFQDHMLTSLKYTHSILTDYDFLNCSFVNSYQGLSRRQSNPTGKHHHLS